jgi:hypothetical protein
MAEIQFSQPTSATQPCFASFEGFQVSGSFFGNWCLELTAHEDIERSQQSRVYLTQEMVPLPPIQPAPFNYDSVLHKEKIREGKQCTQGHTVIAGVET